MNSVVELKQGAITSPSVGRMAVADIIQHVAIVQEVMRAVMRPDVHYGRIPGAGDKPTLLKAGAEVLCMVFRIADSYEVTDLSTADSIRYRVNCIGTHQTTGIIMGSGLGEASSSEEKYKWRKAVCKEEFEATPANMRRAKFAKAKGGGFYMQEQVRTEPLDLANTILKMANKRAKMAMTLNVTAASDCFSQDLEDMDEALRDHLTRHEDDAPATPVAQPIWPDAAFEKQLPKFLSAIQKGKTPEEIISWAETKGAMTDAQKAKLRESNKMEAAPAVSFAEIADKLATANDLSALDVAADMISAAPECHRGELTAIYERRYSEVA